MVNFLHGVHATIGFGKQVLDVKTVLRAERRSHAQCNQIAAGNFPSSFYGQLVQATRFFIGALRIHSGSDDHKFISAHTRNIIVAATALFEVGGKIFQQVVTLEVAVEIVNLLEVVEIANHHRKGSRSAAAASKFPREVEK